MPRYFEDFQIGEELETPGRTVTEADLVRYAAISGDHDSLDLAATGRDRRPAVPDLLVMNITSGLGFRLPVEPPHILAFMTFDLRVQGPVHVGDTIRCRVRVHAKRPMRDAGVLVEQRTMLNQRDEVVLETEYKLLVARRPPEAAR